jgi:hypothetical protein
MDFRRDKDEIKVAVAALDARKDVEARVMRNFTVTVRSIGRGGVLTHDGLLHDWRSVDYFMIDGERAESPRRKVK